jgi:hypothetical protein
MKLLFCFTANKKEATGPDLRASASYTLLGGLHDIIDAVVNYTDDLI